MGYLFWLTIFVLAPSLYLWYLNFNLLWKYKKTILYAIFFAFIFSIPWDILAVKNIIWFFPKEGNVGIILGRLPIEEYLFMSTVTLLISSLTIALKYKGQLKP